MVHKEKSLQAQTVFKGFKPRSTLINSFGIFVEQTSYDHHTFIGKFCILKLDRIIIQKMLSLFQTRIINVIKIKWFTYDLLPIS